MAAATVSTVAGAYLRHLERQSKAGLFSKDHLSNIRRDLTRFSVFIGPDLLASACKQHHLADWLEANDQWHSVHTKRNAVASVTGAFRWAADEDQGLIERTPFRTPRALKGLVAKPRRPATAEEYRELFRHGSRSLRNALFFLRETGARTCEMREVLWDDITFGPQACIVLFIHKTARKTGKGRVIALNSVVARFLLWVRRTSKSPHVFVNCDGGAWDRRTFAKHLRRTAQRIGLDDGVVDRVSGYCFRHTYACDAVEAGFTSKEVADQLGHTDTTMVERVYASHTRKNLANLSRNAELIRERRA